MPELQQKVETRLKNLILNKDQELADLIYDLGYEYENEDYSPLFKEWTKNQRELVNQITRLGYHGDFSIFWVRFNNERLNKTAQRNIINLINRRFPYNLCIFSNLDDTIWDFVNIKAVKDEPSEDDKEPKKRQYLRRIRIDQQERLRTAVERISYLKVPVDGTHHFELQQRHDNAFDVESLNKEFYNKIAMAFTKLVGGKRKVGSRTQEFEPLLKLPSTDDHQKMQEFAVRLIGRLVFCWFLKKKKGDSDLPLIPETVLAKNAIESKYYHTVLEPLFFEVLNTPFDDRIEKYKSDNWQHIPFLNGGLFEPNREDYYEIDDVIHQSKFLNTLVIPDNWFTELFEIFEGYNFTIEENTSIDIDLSIDPEILGRIFENLLAEINPETGETARKNTGSYYTPRPIVDYMVDESIKQYLLTNTEIDEEKIIELLDYSDEKRTITENEKKIIVTALDKIKIIDPACGSGAFPMGILKKMLLILQKVDPESVEWLIKQLDRIPDANVRREVEEKLVNENWNYIHKLGIIQNSIYGVDLQPIATEISKLRFFLSLIVDGKIDDNKPNRGLKPLPNLEFKFVCANSLIGLPESESDADQVGMFTDTFFNDFSQAVNDYFNASNPDEKHSVREKIEALIDGKTDQKFEHIQSLNKRITADPRRIREREQETVRLTQLMELWGSYKNLFNNEPVGFFDIQYFFPECKDGFDVVIANPPYGIKMDTKLRDEYGLGNKDSYGLFMVLAPKHLLKPEGIMSYIVSDTWLTIKTHFKLREQMMEKQMLNVIRLHQDCFMATVNSCIFHLKNTPNENGNFIAADITNISTKTELTELNEKLFNLYEYIGTATPKFAVYEYEQDLIKTNSNLPVFVASPKLFALMNDTTCNTIEKEGISVRQIEMNGKTVELVRFGDVAEIKQGLATGDNQYYLYQNPEARGNYKDINQYKEILLSDDELEKISNDEELRLKVINRGLHKNRNEANFDPDLWFDGKYIVPHDKGGESDSASGWLPNYFVPTNYYIDWSCESVNRLKTYTIADRIIEYNEKKKILPHYKETLTAVLRSPKMYFTQGISISRVGIYSPTFRINSCSTFDSAESVMFSKIDLNVLQLTAVTSSKIIRCFLKICIGHTVNTQADEIKELPICINENSQILKLVKLLIEKQKQTPRYDYMSNEQKEIDKLVYEMYGLNEDDIKEVETWYARRYPKLARFAEVE